MNEKSLLKNIPILPYRNVFAATLHRSKVKPFTNQLRKMNKEIKQHLSQYQSFQSIQRIADPFLNHDAKLRFDFRLLFSYIFLNLIESKKMTSIIVCIKAKKNAKKNSSDLNNSQSNLILS